jgi:hypothetical protein
VGVKNAMKLRCMASVMTLTVLAVSPSPGQERQNGDGELFVMAGGTLGGIGAYPVIAGGAGARFSRYLMGLLEASVIPFNNQTLLPTPAVSVRGSDLFDFNFALQGTIPIRRWEPYGTFGTAVLMNQFTGAFPQPAGQIAEVGQRHSKFGLEMGAGVRWYAGERWGIRAEYRYTSSVQNFNRVLGGFFYRIDADSFWGIFPMFGRHFK